MVMMQYAQFIVYIIVIAIITNLFRFKMNETVDKLMLVMSTFALIIFDGILFDSIHTEWLAFLFICVSIISFFIYGAIVSVSIASFVLSIQTDVTSPVIMLEYILFALGSIVLYQYFLKIKGERDRWLSYLIDNSKQLSVLKGVSTSIQKALQLEKLIKTILTTVTAGYGLGFNRAMILLVDDEEEKHLKGIMGTGPMNADEGYATWESIVKNKFKLKELIEISETEVPRDTLLNQHVKELCISLEEKNFLSQALDNGNPLHIKEHNISDQTLQDFVKRFNMTEFAVIPLIQQGDKVGVLIIDNPVNKNPITVNDIDSTIPIANQAAIAIQNARLYSKVQDMALKDGLTGLYNQRAFQTLSSNIFSNENTLSVIILDIDNFKHFNDTNGHILGNEVLSKLSNVIQGTIDSHHIACRYGGEEFVILLPKMGKNQAVELAEEIRSNVVATKFPCEENQPTGHLTISLGVASTECTTVINPDQLLDYADKALYKAKATGKNKVILFEGD
ncbi:sensor domain-containing diguanylate cyclase [Bacillus sp. HMF5848]|uniref:sensor domain-containing diguanylate cyclase n=1 Tax=Bacillus sp. HMF5848 TaxID=2495421 RepID=UPI000F79D86A|nr:diguanylate cyclase [Bacillus sp. HMF5848]RSK26240.1 sensor domain-containing diguanylate cyclase [Bacillus sp. HMF5848]